MPSQSILEFRLAADAVIVEKDSKSRQVERKRCFRRAPLGEQDDGLAQRQRISNLEVDIRVCWRNISYYDLAGGNPVYYVLDDDPRTIDLIGPHGLNLELVTRRFN